MTISQANVDALFGQEGRSAPPAEPTQDEAAERAPTQSPQTTSAPAQDPPRRDLRRVLGLSLPVTVTLAERNMPIEMILAIRVGTIVEFDVLFDAELTLCLANQPIGKGHAVKAGENFGLRITSINTVQDRIAALGRGSSSA